MLNFYYVIAILILLFFVFFYTQTISLLRDIKEELGGVCRYETATNGGSREKEEEEKVKTTGAGAFSGMIAGALLGLPFGPAGVLIGGILGAIIGDNLEYRHEKERMERMKKLRRRYRRI